MRWLKGIVAGALALGGLVFAQGEASARPMVAPELVQVAAVSQQGAEAPAAAAPCYYGWHRHYWHPRYGWRRHYWHPRYGWRRHYYRPAFYGYHRPWGWHRGWGWRHHYGWRRHW